MLAGRAAAAALAALAVAAVVPGLTAGSGSPASTATAPDADHYPWASRIADARRYARGRRGVKAFAVVDERGRLHRGMNADRTWFSASVVKAMMMVAYLDHPTVRHRPLRWADRHLLVPMITRSDNVAATRIRDFVGSGAIAGVARRAHMRHFSVAAVWGSSHITAAAQARFFRRIDLYVVKRHRKYARRLLASVV